MRIYQASTGQWIFFDGSTKHFFESQAEAVKMSNKITFAQEIQNVATLLAQAGEGTDRIHRTYFDRGYNSGGANEIVDADLESLDLTAAQISAFVTLAEQLEHFLNNAAVTSADYDSTLNRLRTDV